MQVEVNVESVFAMFRTIFSIEVPATITKANQVSGLSKTDYSHYLNEARIQCLRMLPAVFVNFRDACLPYIQDLSPILLKFSHE